MAYELERVKINQNDPKRLQNHHPYLQGIQRRDMKRLSGEQERGEQ